MSFDVEELIDYDFDEIPNVIKLTGVSWGGRQEIISQLKPKDQLVLKRDHKNQYDRNAISVNDLKGNNIGWIPKGQAELLAPLLDAGLKWDINVKQLIGSEDTNYGVLINLFQI